MGAVPGNYLVGPTLIILILLPTANASSVGVQAYVGAYKLFCPACTTFPFTTPIPTANASSEGPVALCACLPACSPSCWPGHPFPSSSSFSFPPPTPLLWVWRPVCPPTCMSLLWFYRPVGLPACLPSFLARAPLPIIILILIPTANASSVGVEACVLA